jgi:hypothetical protein
VLAPTRELAEQIAQVMSDLARDLPQSVKVVTAVGGVSINPQMMALRGGADIVIATPGRLLDLLAHNALSFRGLRTLVLDEADRLLELGFEDELAELLDALPSPRQTLLFSATFPDEVLGLAAQLLRDPARVEIAAGPPAVIQQRAIAVDASRRTQLLRRLIETHGWPQVRVFVAAAPEQATPSRVGWKTIWTEAPPRSRAPMVPAWGAATAASASTEATCGPGCWSRLASTTLGGELAEQLRRGGAVPDAAVVASGDSVASCGGEPCTPAEAATAPVPRAAAHAASGPKPKRR